MRIFNASERRHRLVRRHYLGPESAGTDVVSLAERLVGLHATDPATVFLTAQARIPGLTIASVEAALYDDRTLIKHLGMRRTVFVLPLTLVPIVQAACTDSIAAAQRKRLVKDVEQGGVAVDGKRWLGRAERATVQALEAMGSATGAQLSKAVPALRAKIVFGEGKTWGREVGVASRVFTILAAEGRIVRSRPNGSWTSSQHRWTLAPGASATLPEPAARAELVRRWLAAFGPASVADIAWWTGLGVGRIRSALDALGTVEVSLQGEAGVALPDDLEPTEPSRPRPVLLPSLDPTTMGWQRRDWYLGAHGPRLFDRNGNAGPTVWWDGRIVGGWAQRRSGEIVYELLDDVGAEADEAVATEAGRLQAWLGETVVTPRFPTPLERQLRG